MLKDISRTAVDRYLKVVRKPIDAVLNRRDSDRSKALGARLDRADAAARSVAGTALRDPQLKEDATNRRKAVEDRERAERLRGVATEHRQASQAEAEEVEEEAEQRKRRAAQAAERRKKAAQKRKEGAKKGAAKKTTQRKQAAKKEEAQTKSESAKQTKREQLQQLEAKEAALKKDEESLTAAAESQRLADAAAEAKAKRKNGS